MHNNELMHYGVLGMKWGVRRYQNKDGSLTNAGIKRYAKKGFAEDAYNSNRTTLGKAYDKYTGAHKISAELEYESSSQKKRKERAEKYLSDQNKKKQSESEWNKKISQTKQSLSKGEKVINTLMGREYANAYVSSIASGNSKGRSIVTGLLTGEIGARKLKNTYISKSVKK